MNYYLIRRIVYFLICLVEESGNIWLCWVCGTI